MDLSYYFYIIFAGLPLLCLLIVVHEFGHFIVAKLCGVGVIKFSIGLGKSLFKFRHKETTYQLALIPFGGFVRMVGDMPETMIGEQVLTGESSEGDESEEAEVSTPQEKPLPFGVTEEDLTPDLKRMLDDKNYWFTQKNYFQKSAIVFAGPLFNFIFSAFAISVMVYFYGKPISNPLYGGDVTEIDYPAEISEVAEGSPAEIAGVLPNDLVTQIDDKEVQSWKDISDYIKSSEGKQISFRLENDTGSREVKVNPLKKEVTFGDETKEFFMVGITPRTTEDAGMIESVKSGVLWTKNASLSTCVGIYKLIIGDLPRKELGGPITIFSQAASHAKRGFQDLLGFAAILSVSLAVLNLLPIPVLDGGHLVIFTVEAIFGDLNIKIKEIAQCLGLLIILSLMGFGIYNDLTRDALEEPAEINWTDSSSDGSSSKDSSMEETAR